MAVPDRIEKLIAQSKVTGIDFIYVYPSQTLLDIYFYRDPKTLNNPLSNNLGEIKIYSPSGSALPIATSNLGLKNINGKWVLRVQAAKPITFALYNLLIVDSRIDPYFNDVKFSFKANCPSDLDCKPSDHECPPEEPNDFPIDYSARDFWSYRSALLEFASLRYPGWNDRLPADAGVMLAEVMSAMGDEMAYYQDRIGHEAYLENATQRRSLRQHSRLVDYHIHDGLGAFAWIDVTVTAPMNGNISAGTNIWSVGEDGTRTDFEIGTSLNDAIKGNTYFVDAKRNEFTAYRWDEDQLCLPVGTTDMYIDGHHKADLLNFAGLTPDKDNGKWVLLKTTPVNPAQPARALMVCLIAVTELTDPVFNNQITHIVWQEDQALPFEMDMTQLFVRGNMLPSTSGKTHSQYFIAGAALESLPAPDRIQLEADAKAVDALPVLKAIEREGSDSSVIYRSSLNYSEENNLAWLGLNPEKASPEVHLDELEFVSLNWQIKQAWTYKSSFVGVNSSDSQDTHFTIDDGSWRRVIGYWRTEKEIVHEDYASGNGATIRFGNGEFGLIPVEKSVFRTKYRLGGGRVSNLAPDAITNFDHFDPALNFVGAVSNPLNAVNGVDPETPVHIRQSAPEAFRTITYRAVREEDYAEAIERLSWVQKAGATFRWTGSWLTLFATPDPKRAVVVKDEWKKEMREQLDRFRQAGREAHSLDPLYADIDLEIEVCALPDVYPGELKERILIRLFGKKGVNPVEGFFSPDRFTFGDSLERSQLEAAIHEVQGVRAIEYILYRRRGMFEWKRFNDYSYDPGKNSIIRVENDPLHPERGTLKIYIHGGA